MIAGTILGGQSRPDDVARVVTDLSPLTFPFSDKDLSCFGSNGNGILNVEAALLGRMRSHSYPAFVVASNIKTSHPRKMGSLTSLVSPLFSAAFALTTFLSSRSISTPSTCSGLPSSSSSSPSLLSVSIFYPHVIS